MRETKKTSFLSFRDFWTCPDPPKPIILKFGDTRMLKKTPEIAWNVFFCCKHHVCKSQNLGNERGVRRWHWVRVCLELFTRDKDEALTLEAHGTQRSNPFCCGIQRHQKMELGVSMRRERHLRARSRASGRAGQLVRPSRASGPASVDTYRCQVGGPHDDPEFFPELANESVFR